MNRIYVHSTCEHRLIFNGPENIAQSLPGGMTPGRPEGIAPRLENYERPVPDAAKEKVDAAIRFAESLTTKEGRDKAMKTAWELASKGIAEVQDFAKQNEAKIKALQPALTQLGPADIQAFEKSTTTAWNAMPQRPQNHAGLQQAVCSLLGIQTTAGDVVTMRIRLVARMQEITDPRTGQRRMVECYPWQGDMRYELSVNDRLRGTIIHRMHRNVPDDPLGDRIQHTNALVTLFREVLP